MMGKLAARHNGNNRQSKTQIYQSRRWGQVEVFMTHITMIEEIIKIGIDQIVEIGEFNLVDKVEVDKGTNKIIGEEILEVMWEHTKILEDRIVEENIEVIIEMKIISEKEVEVGLGKDHFQEILVIEGMIEA